MTLGPLEIAALCAAALAAGTVDAIAGGGGLLTLPALLAVGLPPHQALGTNKGQSVFGTLAALVRFDRAKLVDRDRARITFPMGIAGAAAGAGLALLVPGETLRPLILVLLVAIAAFLTFRPRGASVPEGPVTAPGTKAAAIAVAIAAYDGFFGPGTGTFLILAFVGVLHLPAARASADAKVVNFASNLAAVAVFTSRGLVVWEVALPMALAQIAGGALGAHIAVRRGDALVRRVVLLVVVALAAKLAWDLHRG